MTAAADKPSIGGKNMKWSVKIIVLFAVVSLMLRACGKDIRFEDEADIHRSISVPIMSTSIG